MRRANYLGLSYQFWTLTKESINEMKKQGNKSLIMSPYDPDETDEEFRKKYYQKTKWNDFNIGVPVLFNFYHGLELCMKGLLQEIEQFPLKKKNHGLTSYYELIIKNRTKFTPELINSLDKVLNSENSFSDFFNSNNSNVDNYYQLLRYPESYKGEHIFHHVEIRGKERIGLDNFESIKNSCEEIENYIIEWLKLT
ncbi:hypothetical protein [Olleya sp. HaHaR_3_96]|uniref:hypothetical protein n=1 Tax=Olleya sp. HaHaR_3_96 TaxID=2745560 RepID=UPI001C4EE607|nr:hypothetical protein [Olleya sp. HaHaR_3_96]QXP59712.1 hypothetical protein H0I26_17660 [Olleya sp. HaHaR_3_96]